MVQTRLKTVCIVHTKYVDIELQKHDFTHSSLLARGITNDESMPAAPPSPQMVLFNVPPNGAQGADRADGGHIYTSGTVSIAGRVNFREGFARRHVSSEIYNSVLNLCGRGPLTCLPKSSTFTPQAKCFDNGEGTREYFTSGV